MKKIYKLLFAACLYSSLAQAQGIYQMWGMTLNGRDSTIPYPGGGTIFSLNSEGNNFQTRHFFSPINGDRPLKTNFSQYNGKLYAMTSAGGGSNYGAIFEWDLATNTYTKKIAFNNTMGSTPYGGLVLYQDKFYGMTKAGGTNGSGVIFEWDPATNIFTKKIDFSALNGRFPEGNLTMFAGKFYGLTTSGGVNDAGVIFEWDPLTNVYSKKIDFNGLDGSEPRGSLVVNGTKLYGVTARGGNSDYGVIFEWDPSSNIYTKKYDFNYADGVFPKNSLTVYSGTSFYGCTAYGGSSGAGVVFEWNSATNVYTKKIDLDYSVGADSQGNLTYSNGKYYNTASFGGSGDSGTVFQWDPISNVATKKVDFSGYYGSIKGISPYSTLVSVSAPVAKGALNTCTSFLSITIDNTNNNVWVPIVDNLGDAIAEIKANGNNLGVVNTSMYINGGPVREDAAHKLYLDRNLTITPTVQPGTPVNIRLYLKGSEYEALRTATNSLGQPSGINSINDVGLFKNNEGCLPVLQNTTSQVVATGEAWNGDYVITATVNSFSSFYAAKKADVVLPLALLEFNARLINNDALLNWKTTNEVNTNSFEIERSFDGRIFTKAGAVVANNTDGEHRYAFKDAGISTPNAQRVYYRLKQKDNDDRFSYSQVVVLNLSSSKSLFIYPNPAGETLTITFSSAILLHSTASVVDFQGREVQRFIINNHQEKIDISNLSVGMYAVKLADGTAEKFFKN